MNIVRFSRLSIFLRNAIAALSFLVYALAILSLNQAEAIRFAVEQHGPVPAALSHLLFGSRLGSIDTGLTKFFREEAAGTSAKQSIERAVKGGASQSHQLRVSADGVGVGGLIAASAAFSIFGARAESLPLFFLLVLGISAILFVARYQDGRMLAVPILLFAFTAVLLTPISTMPSSEQIPFGGVRSYAIVGILPALHWCLEFAAGGPTSSRRHALLRWVILGAQVAILALGILVRPSGAYLVVAVILSAAYWRFRNSDLTWTRLAKLLTPCAAILVVLFVLMPLSFPDYERKGLTNGVVWHRVLISFGVNPSWPFRGLSDTYTCPEIPEGLVRQIFDRNGHCVWVSYTRGRNISAAVMRDGVYGREYEHVMRNAVTNIAASYPRETLKTFFYFKPKWTIEQIVYAFKPRLNDTTRMILPFAILQIIAMLAFLFVRPGPSKDADGMRILGLFLILSFVPQFVAWTTPYTAIDLFSYLLCGIAAFVLLLFSFGTRLVISTIRGGPRQKTPLQPSKADGKEAVS